MGFLLEAMIEAMKIVFLVGLIYAILNQPFQTQILPLLDDVGFPGIATFKAMTEWVWNSWGLLIVVGVVIYVIVAALRKPTTYEGGTY